MGNEPVCLMIRYGEERKVLRACTALLARRKAEPLLPAECAPAGEEAFSPILLLCCTGEGLGRLLEADLFLVTDGHASAFGASGGPSPALVPPARSFNEAAAKREQCRTVVIR